MRDLFELYGAACDAIGARGNGRWRCIEAGSSSGLVEATRTSDGETVLIAEADIEDAEYIAAFDPTTAIDLIEELRMARHILERIRIARAAQRGPSILAAALYGQTIEDAIDEWIGYYQSLTTEPAEGSNEREPKPSS